MGGRGEGVGGRVLCKRTSSVSVRDNSRQGCGEKGVSGNPAGKFMARKVQGEGGREFERDIGIDHSKFVIKKNKDDFRKNKMLLYGKAYAKSEKYDFGVGGIDGDVGFLANITKCESEIDQTLAPKLFTKNFAKISDMETQKHATQGQDVEFIDLSD